MAWTVLNSKPIPAPTSRVSNWPQSKLLPVRTCTLTSDGFALANIDNTREPFGGDIGTGLIESTIYTLARECHSRIAIELFIGWLIPQFFDATNDLTDVLRNQLAAETNLRLILNEGAARGLNAFPCKGSWIWTSRWKARVDILRSYINTGTMAS
jgi:hypothetical protein